MMRTTPLAVLCLCGLLLLPGCKSLQGMLSAADRPTARVTGASIRDIRADAIALDFEIEVQNPYDVPLPLASMDYSLASAGSRFLDGDAALSTSVPAKGSKSVTLPVQIRPADLLSAVSGVRPGQVVPYEAVLGLSVDAPGVGPLTLPLRRTGDLPVPAVPNVELAKVTWDELSLKRASASVAFDVRNTNEFALDLAALQTGLELGGRAVGDASTAESLRLGPGEEGRFVAPVSFSPLDFGMGLFNVLRGSETEYRVRGSLQGSTPLGPIELPFDQKGRVPLVAR